MYPGDSVGMVRNLTLDFEDGLVYTERNLTEQTVSIAPQTDSIASHIGIRTLAGWGMCPCQFGGRRDMHRSNGIIIAVISASVISIGIFIPFLYEHHCNGSFSSIS